MPRTKTAQDVNTNLTLTPTNSHKMTRCERVGQQRFAYEAFFATKNKKGAVLCIEEL